MIEAAQEEVCRFLLDARTHGVGADQIKRIDTHIAIVVLAGDKAYKLKRAVTLPFVDFSSLESRMVACQAEVRLNRRTAPDIYLRAMSISREPDGRLVFDGSGEVVDWVVAMRRFDETRLLDRLAQQGKLGPEVALRLAETIVDFHAQAEPAPDGADGDEMLRVARVNADRLRRYVGTVFDAATVDEINSLSEARVEACRDLLAARRAQGFVRHCHGDLHLRNIFLADDRPVIFDAIEFDDRLARTDVMYDLAFLLMDLWHRGLGGLASIVLNRYLLLTGDDDGLRPLPLFLSQRAAIRAHVSATMAETSTEPAATDALEHEAGEYLRLARVLLDQVAPCLVAVGGYSGTGKSTLAVPPEQPLEPEAYAPEVSHRVYAELRRRAATVLATGYCAVVDAVNDHADSRRKLAAIAKAANVTFAGIWLAAVERTMAGRIEKRGRDASDATPEVMREQIAKGSVPSEWAHLDAELGANEVLRHARSHLVAAGILPPKS